MGARGSGGGMGIRTPDPDLAKVVLYQLSYAPVWGAGDAGMSAPGVVSGGLVWTRTRDLTLIRRVL